MSIRFNSEDVPELPGWVTIPDAAKILNLSRQYVHRLAVSGTFTSLHRVGSTFVINVWEVNDIAGNYEILDKDETTN
jgi:hypothetical protein